MRVLLLTVLSIFALESAGQATYTSSQVTISAACTADSNCNTGSCCMKVSKSLIASTPSWSTVVQVCMPYDLNGLSMPNGTYNYTFACANATTTAATAYTTSLGAQCSSNSDCAGTGGCCAARSY